MSLTINPNTFEITSSARIHGKIVVFKESAIADTTLLAANIANGVIMRDNAGADFTDTTDTATNILAAIPSATIGTAFSLRIINTTQYTQTIAAGAGVTLNGTMQVPAYSCIDLIGVFTAISVPTITITNIGISKTSQKKEYKAVMIQAFANPPIAGAIFENTIGNIVWSYVGVGEYEGTLAGAFPEGKTFFNFNLGNDSVFETSFNLAWTSINTIKLRTFQNGVLTNGVFGYANLKIETYP